MRPSLSSLPSAALLLGALAMVPAAQAQVGRNGQLDAGFGTQGKVTLQFPGGLNLSESGLVDVALLPSGQMIVAATVINGNGDTDFGTIRLNADGSLDTSYGVNGGRRVGFDRAGSSNNDVFIGLALQADGKALLSGLVAGGPDDQGDMGVVRLTTTGQLDSSFGSGGRVLVPFNLGGIGQREDTARRIAVQTDGKILVTGDARAAGGDVDLAVVRLNPNGTRDTSFDGDGRVTVDFGAGYNSLGFQVRQLADGKILVGGAAALNGSPNLADFILVRFNADGSLDTGFGDGGKVVFDFAVGGNSLDIAYDFLESADGTVLACGGAAVNWPNNRDMACMRVLADGSLDAGYPAVLVPFDRGGDFQDFAVGMARDEQGRIVLGGAARRATDNSDVAVARLLPNGDPDPGFGNAGSIVHNSCNPVCLPTETDNLASDLVLQPDGKIVIAGWVANSSGDYRFQVMRLLGDVVFSSGFEP